MMYTNGPQYADFLAKASRYVNKRVRTTDDREGVVTDAWPGKDNSVTLWVVDKHGNTFFTDTDHATMERGQS